MKTEEELEEEKQRKVRSNLFSLHDGSLWRVAIGPNLLHLQRFPTKQKNITCRHGDRNFEWRIVNL